MYVCVGWWGGEREGGGNLLFTTLFHSQHFHCISTEVRTCQTAVTLGKESGR